ncbi:pantetheine-phosphate adenylyltransferase [Janthinobacterium agaricidamnosum]|uniref:Phosphopantetheine adenylyltransferase n=1 Tax=Janthinobacterium agaricidamnosum NBRC 102515 = DSM 9628 TaxID=1349767 RepID=W0V321_9BURK|nr:pantetheine-phosphate adenylyltransferase [Janthinobacterium agaricidamnosum]CDG81970.1 pantetheine-phosphate adenylyltransferase [Janthinobacterium agaricidamnosum NBRC 102515 = DSM 9628]
MKKIGFSGTLDPITNGHMWVIGEARSIADEVIVFLSQNPAKKPQFPAEDRKRIIEQSARECGWNNVQVVIVKGDYTARAAKKHGADYLIRGIRTTADFDYENLIQQTNVDVLQGAKTIFVMPPRDLGSVSSSFVKALEGPVGWNWTMKKFVPGPAYQAWILDWLRKDWETLWNYAGTDAASVASCQRWFDHLTGADAYGGAGRFYHNLDHLVHGLCEIRVWAANTLAPRADSDLVKKAFWFHDAHYEHGGEHDEDGSGLFSNEELSAQLWLESGLDSGANLDVAQLIRATDHFQGPAIEHRLKEVMLGVDLAILGQDEEVYRAYTLAIRQEYAHVEEERFKQQRGQALLHLRGKAQAGLMFGDPYFAEQYNEQAIANMTREIEALGTV